MKFRPLAWILLALSPNLSPAQTVMTQFGQVQGSQNGAVVQFLGIPFAKPPLDSLRWRPPLPPDSWAGTLNATAFSPVCPQKAFSQADTNGTPIGDEDCLYLNVWTPQTGIGNRAVMVFIHGGGNQQGSASESAGGTPLYFGKNLAERGDVVVVTIQYRLGPLGFLVHPGLADESPDGISGNYAVMDQILALQWVQNNIAQFGGDPSNVMLFGESAGGVNVGNLLTTPTAAGLFHKACIQSAIPSLKAYSLAETDGTDFVDGYQGTGTNAQKIAYMRSLPADSLIKNETSPLSGGFVQMGWSPVVDGVYFSNFPNQIFQSGVFNKVPLMMGSNSEEMGLSAPPVVTPAMVTGLTALYVPWALQPTAQALYPPGTTNAQARVSYVGMLTDAQFTAPVRRTAQCISLNQTEPVWRYFFTGKHSVAQLQTFGSYHGMELFYVFNNWENATLGSGSLFKPSDDSMQVNLLSYWTNFAKTGNPNAGTLPAWPLFQAPTDCYLELKATPNGTQCGIRTAQCDLWDDAIGFGGCTGTVGAAGPSPKIGGRFYPNPSEGLFVWEGPSPVGGWAVWDAVGKKVLSSPEGQKIDLTGFPPGIYVVEGWVGGELVRGKVEKR